MVFGYYVYEVFLAVAAAQSTALSSFVAAMTASAVGIPFNIVQGVVGAIIALALLPILLKINDIRDWINK